METEILDNTLRSYLHAAETFLAIMAAVVLLRRWVLDRLKKLAELTKTEFHDALLDILAQIRGPELTLIAFYLSTRQLNLHPYFNKILAVITVLILTGRGVRIIQDLVEYAIVKIVLPPGAADASRRTMVRNLSLLADGVLWFAGALFAMDVLGVNVSAMLAGLGIGGIAVALAAQAILSDLFSAISIFLDKPFVVGDVIVVDNLTGTVEHIGIKTTRVRALSGEMLIFSNSLLTSSKIRNFQHLRERRVVFSFGLTHQAPLEQIRKVPDLIRDIIVKTGHVRFDRAHFKGFGEYSLEYEVVYYVMGADYNLYMDLNQKIHLAILEAFQKENISFAYPTRTLIKTP